MQAAYSIYLISTTVIHLRFCEMEVDLDIDDLDFGDKIKEFLQHKLNEIKTINLSKEQKIKERKQYVNEILQTSGDSKEKLCLVTVHWKKYFNNKFVICYIVCSNNKTSLGNLKLFLHFSPPQQLNYKYFVYVKDSVICDNEIQCKKVTDDLEKIYSGSSSSEAYVVAVIDDPNFLEKLQYDIVGKLSILDENKDALIDLPKVEISSEDYTNTEMCDVSLTTSKLDSILVVLSATEKVELVLIFPEHWTISLDSTFEIHCSLTKIKLLCSCKSYFVANRLSQVFDDTILELHSTKTGSLEEICASVYFSSKSGLLSFLHHIHKYIKGLIIIPKLFYQHYKIRDCKEGQKSDILQRFQDSIDQEIKLIGLLGGKSGTTNKYRANLINAESETDILYLKLCQINNDCSTR